MGAGDSITSQLCGTSPLKHICKEYTAGLKEMQRNTLLNNPQVKEEITMEIGKYFELNRNENGNKSTLVGMQLKVFSEQVFLTWGKNSGTL